jgi:hypothetical protein
VSGRATAQGQVALSNSHDSAQPPAHDPTRGDNIEGVKRMGYHHSVAGH